jgi:hypothetical protein
MKFTVLLFILAFTAWGTLDAQVVISTQQQSFTSNNLQSANDQLKQRSDTLPFRIYYVPGTWSLPPDRKKVDTAIGVTKLLSNDALFTSPAGFSDLHAKAYQQAKSYFDALKDKDSSIVVLDHVGVRAGEEKYEQAYEYIFGDSIPAELRQRIQEYRPDVSMNVAESSQSANDKYLSEYIAFIAYARRGHADIQYPHVWPFVELYQSTLKANYYTSEHIPPSILADIKVWFSDKPAVDTPRFGEEIVNMNYVPGMALKINTPFRNIENGPIGHTPPDRSTIKWKLNGKDIAQLQANYTPDLEALKDSFVNGVNEVEYSADYNAVEFTNKGVRVIKLQFNYIDPNDPSLLKYFVMASRKANVYKRYDVPVYIGEAEKEKQLYVGDKLTLQLFEKGKDKEKDKQVKEPIWDYGGEVTKIKDYSFTLKAGIDIVDVKQKDDPDPTTIRLKMVDTSGMGLVYAQIDTDLDTSPLSKEQADTANGLYKVAVEAFKKTDPDAYKAFFEKTKVKVHFSLANDPIFMTKTGGTLMGQTIKGLGYTSNYSLLDTLDCTFDEGGVVVNDAKLVCKLNIAEKRSLLLSANEKVINEKAEEMLQRVRLLFPDLADRMRAKVLAGEYVATSIDSMRYEVERKDLTNFITFNQKVTNVYLNYTNLMLDYNGLFDPGVFNTKAVTKVFVHEVAHAIYPLEQPMIYMKWDVIRDKFKTGSAALSDRIKTNMSCSEGPGHEMHNPETVRVCDISKRY